jgi:Glycosyltransferase GT-D fold
MDFMRYVQAARRRLTWRRLIRFPGGCVRIQSPQATLTACENAIRLQQRGAYLRFGDGEVNIAWGTGAIEQQADCGLQQEMRGALALGGEGVFKSLMIHSQLFGCSSGMQDGLFMSSDDWARNSLSKVFEYFVGSPIYSSVALHYMALFSRAECVRFLRLLKHCKPVFVGNEDVPPEVVGMLFGQSIHVRTPARSAYQEIDHIEQEVLRVLETRRGYTVLSVAAGPTGNVLQRRILNGSRNTNLFLFNFGSLLDAFCGWKTRAWMDLSGLPDSYYQELLRDVASE